MISFFAMDLRAGQQKKWQRQTRAKASTICNLFYKIQFDSYKNQTTLFSWTILSNMQIIPILFLKYIIRQTIYTFDKL